MAPLSPLRPPTLRPRLPRLLPTPPSSHTADDKPKGELHSSNNNSKNNNSHDRCVEDGDAAATALPTGPFAPDMATVLQLVVFSMRLTELHHELYSAVYRYLQRHDSIQHTMSETNTSFPACAKDAGSLPPLSVSLSVAGVALAPHPRFQLELMLQAGAHYLGRSKQNLRMISYPSIQPQHTRTHAKYISFSKFVHAGHGVLTWSSQGLLHNYSFLLLT